MTLEAGEEGSMVAGPIALTESGSVTVWNSDKGLSLYTGEGLQLLETPLMPAWKPRQMAGKEHALLVATEQHELKLVRVMLLGDAPNLEEVTVEGVQGTVRAVAFR